MVMYKLAESSRIQNIENRFKCSIKKILYNWHQKDNLKHSEIGEKIGIPRSTITKWFRYFNVPTQSCTRFTNLNLLNVGPQKSPPAKPKIRKIRPWKVNKNFFNQWSSEMSYVLGFFCADGSMYKNPRGSHYITFNITDKGLLIKIKNLLGIGHKLSLKKRLKVNHNWKKSWVIQIGSKNIFYQFLKFGITPQKAQRLRIPIAPKKYISDFIRGYFDGDGGVWCGFIHKNDRKNPTRMLVSTFTSSSEGMLRDVADCLHRMANTRLKNPTFRDGAFCLCYSTNDSRKIYKFIYNNESKSFLNGLYLDRKKIVFEKYLGA